MAQETIEIEAETLEEAREQIKSKIPEGSRLLSEQIISDGEPKTVRAMAETIEAAFTRAQSEIPNGADALEKNELVAPQRKVITVEALNEQEAELSVKQKAHELFDAAMVRNFRLAIQGRKGSFGIGAKPNQYEAEILRPAVVEVTYKTKARLSFNSKTGLIPRGLPRPIFSLMMSA